MDDATTDVHEAAYVWSQRQTHATRMFATGGLRSPGGMNGIVWMFGFWASIFVVTRGTNLKHFNVGRTE